MISTPQPADTAPAGIAPAEFLRRLGEAGDGPHDLAAAGLMLAALDRPEKHLAPFRAHLAELTEAVSAESHFARQAESAALSLSSIIAGHYGYEGEREHYDDPQNADMMAVIERRRGLPVALGILYIHAARASGMEACGLLSPGHFLLKVTVKGSEALIDPFNGGALVEREHLSAPGFGVSHLVPGPGAGSEPGEGDSPDALSPVGDCRCAAQAAEQHQDASIEEPGNTARDRNFEAHDSDCAEKEHIVAGACAFAGIHRRAFGRACGL